MSPDIRCSGNRGDERAIVSFLRAHASDLLKSLYATEEIVWNLAYVAPDARQNCC